MTDINEDSRPNPDALLAEAEKEQRRRGRLKIFLGPAPGVGKTYSMLEAAQKRLEEGVDVLVGIVETHGRKETQELLPNLSVVPRYEVKYRNKAFLEMDTSAILKRHPQLVLVDEMAHTNVPGSRHTKRYLDIEELLDAGIDVYTTVNIQHIESLNDDIFQITRVHVRETIPDAVFEHADEIIVIDLTPDELIQRLHEGRVYVPEQAQLAIRNFFTVANLTALREMALRFAAKNVGSHLLPYMQAHGIAGPWPVSERIMVCISASPVTPRLIRNAKRMADRRDAKMLAVYIDNPTQTTKLTPEQKERIASALRYVEQLGGDTATLIADNSAQEIIRYARENNVTHIVMGKSIRPRIVEFFMGSIVYEVMRHSGKISVHVISESHTEFEQRAPVSAGEKPKSILKKCFYSLGLIVGANLFVALSSNVLPYSDIPLVFLLAIIFIATRWGLYPSLLASVVSFFSYGFFFVQPLYTFSIFKFQGLITLLVFITVSVLLSQLTQRVYAQAKTARLREQETATIYAFTRKIARAMDLDGLLKAITYYMATKLKLHVIAILPGDDGIELRSSYPEDETLSTNAWAAAKWAWENKKTCGIGTDTLSGVGWFYLPLQVADEPVALIGIQPELDKEVLSTDKLLLFKAMAEQAAFAIARMRLVKQAEQTRLHSETEKLRTALLSSVSHNLRMPLASIIGSVSSILEYGDRYDLTLKKNLLVAALEEAERLNRYVSSLLDMTKLESGELELNYVWMNLEELTHSVISYMENILKHHQIKLNIAKQLPLIHVDRIFTEQVLLNLLDNAAKFSPPASTITISLEQQEQWLVLSITDQGKGIIAADLDQIFDMFYQVQRFDRKDTAAPGLGLAICKGIMDAQGGLIKSFSAGEGQGSTFTLYFPVKGRSANHPSEKEAKIIEHV